MIKRKSSLGSGLYRLIVSPKTPLDRCRNCQYCQAWPRSKSLGSGFTELQFL